MKSLKASYLFLFLALGALTFTFTSCEDDEIDLSEFMMNVDFRYGQDALDYNTEYTLNGVKIDLSLVQFYISNIRLVSKGGNEYRFDNIGLINKDDNELDFGTILGGDFTKLRFDVGLDSVINHDDPSKYSQTHPLGSKNPSMHWSWNAGYIFIRMDGMADTDGDNIPETGFECHIGTDNLKRTVELDYNLKATSNNSYTAQVVLDVEKALQSLNITADISTHTTHTMDNMPLAMEVVDDFANAFSMDN